MLSQIALSRCDHRSNDRDSLAGGANSTPAIDVKSLFMRCMGNVSFALTLLGELEATGIKLVEKIARHVADGNCADAAEEAHSFKGAVAILAAEPMRSLAAEIEEAGSLGNLEIMGDLVECLRQEMARCLRDIPRIRDQATKTAP